MPKPPSGVAWQQIRRRQEALVRAPSTVAWGNSCRGRKASLAGAFWSSPPTPRKGSMGMVFLFVLAILTIVVINYRQSGWGKKSSAKDGKTWSLGKLLRNNSRRIIYIALLLPMSIIGILNAVRHASDTSSASINNMPASSSTPVTTKTTRTKASPLPANTPPKTPTPTTQTSNTIQCKIHENCGGGYKETTKEQCDNLTCCTYSLEYPPLLTSKSDCQTRQEYYLPTNNYVPSYPTYSWDYSSDTTSEYESDDYTTTSDDNDAQKYEDCVGAISATYANQQDECYTLSYYEDPRLIDSCLYKAKTSYAQGKTNCEQLYPH
jgi:hypothetical protein